jgi:hypothetical protein
VPDPDNYPYEFWAKALGDGITKVSMTTPDNDVYEFEEWDEYNWGICIEGYTTLTSLRTDLPTGNYTFVFNDGEDSVTLNHNPTTPTGFANITYPAHGSTDIPLNPTFIWDDCTGYGNALAMGMGEEETDDVISGVFLADIALTSWTVGPLNPGRLHWMEVSVYAWTESQPYDRWTLNSDYFTHYDLFENCNAALFATEGSLVNVVADTITPKTKWITCHIWPPEGYDVADIKLDSIRLNAEIPSTRTSVRRKQQMLVVKFSTAALNLEASPELLALTVSGEMTDGTPFVQSDYVTVIEKGRKKN